MRKIVEVLRLFFELGRSKREIARVIGASPTTVSDYLSRIKVAGLSYQLPPEIDEQALDRLLFPPSEPPAAQRPEQTWAHVHCTFKGRHTTIDAHMPPAHRTVAGVTAETLRSQAAAMGPRAGLIALLPATTQHFLKTRAADLSRLKTLLPTAAQPLFSKQARKAHRSNL